MIFYGLDDSQRPLNGDCTAFKKIGLEGAAIIVHYLNLGKSGDYIWTLGRPQLSHLQDILGFLQRYLTNGEVIIACRHYYEIYPPLAGLNLPIYFTTNRRGKTLFYICNGKRKFLECDKNDKRIIAYKSADSASRIVSSEIYKNLAQWDQGGFERIKDLRQHYFGDWPF